jgi:hypothetical protein
MRHLTPIEKKNSKKESLIKRKILSKIKIFISKFGKIYMRIPESKNTWIIKIIQMKSYKD